MQHEENCFVTLTYADPPSDGSLRPEDFQGWLKRLRNRFPERRIRFYGVGEYGERSFRPHYHAALFGCGCQGGPVAVVSGGGRECRCLTCSAVRSSWNYGPIKGHTMVGALEERSAAYIAGYVLKKLGATSPISGVHPPFARMSLKPGIGADAVHDVASVLMQYRLEERDDVPVGLRHGKHVMPLGRYLRKKLRLACGLDEKTPDHVIEAIRQGLLPVFEYADSVASHAPFLKKSVVQDAFAQLNEQDNRNVVARNLRKGSI